MYMCVYVVGELANITAHVTGSLSLTGSMDDLGILCHIATMWVELWEDLYLPFRMGCWGTFVEVVGDTEATNP